MTKLNHQLLKLQGEDDPRIESWLKKKTDKYTSSDIQTEILKLMAMRVLRELIVPIQAPWSMKPRRQPTKNKLLSVLDGSERSFSTLRRSTMTQVRLNNAMLLHIYSNMTESLNLIDIGNDFIIGSEHNLESLVAIIDVYYTCDDIHMININLHNGDYTFLICLPSPLM